MADSLNFPSDEEIRRRLKLKVEQTNLADDSAFISPALAELEEGEKTLARAVPDLPKTPAPRPIPSQLAQKKSQASGDQYLTLGVGISLAYSLIGCTILGWGGGKLIDLQTHGILGQALGTIGGAVVGLGAGIFTITKAQAKSDRPPGKKQDKES